MQEEQILSTKDAVSGLYDKLDGWLDAIILRLPNLAVAILVMVLFYIIAKLMRKFAEKIIFKKVEAEAVRIILSKMLFGVVLIIGFFIALGVLELDKALTSILGAAGVVGLAIGLALQGTLSNTVGGLMLSFLPNIRIGDYIQTGDMSGYVTEINLRNVTLRETDNDYVIIPNSNFIGNPFTNYSLTKRSRVTVSCGVGYEDNLQKVEDLVKRIVGDLYQPQEGEEIEFFFTEFGDSSINFMTRFWIDATKPKPKLEAQHQVIKAIKKSFDTEGINIPFPIRTLDFGKNKLQMISNTVEKE